MDDSLFPDASSPSASPPGGGGDPDGRYCRVAVERGFDTPGERGGGGGDRLDWSGGLTYGCAGHDVAPGQRVEVPLGRGRAAVAGVVLEVGGEELLAGLAPGRVRPIARAGGARLPAALVELGRWIASYYGCPIGMTMSAMLPAAVKRETGRRRRELVERVGVAADGGGDEAPRLTPAVRAAWAAIEAMPEDAFPAEAPALARRAGARNAGPVRRLVEAGLLRTVEVDEVRPRASVWPEGFEAEAGALSAPPEPNRDQAAAVEGIAATIDAGAFGVHLLHGVTGSGKTEVYLRLIERALGGGADGVGGGGSAVVLVPEIALTPQTSGRFLSRFGAGAVAVLHSGLSAGQRHREWRRAASGEARVVIGARSAVFAPVPSLRLVVVDEEHDGGFKQDQLPRYHARDVAIKRAQLESACCVLGSATPSLESWSNATGSGGGAARFGLWRLPTRAGGAAPPRVRVVDLAAERRAAERAGASPGPLLADPIGPALERALRETLGSGGQAILLLNRRGYAGYVACPAASCGWTLGCVSCSTKLVVHRRGAREGQRAPRGFVRCHHCLAEQTPPEACPVCGRRTVLVGGGTQRLEDELRERLGLEPGRDFERVDADTMRRASDYFETLGRFARGELKLLAGTQMLAKGLDFPGVRLVGVLNADTGLHLPDFRAAERTFQLVSQVAGRAGRGAAAGLVIVQTLSPSEPAIVAAAAHDYEGFASGELSLRRASGLPPLTRMARVVCREAEREAAASRAGAIAEALRALGQPGLEVDGPFPCPIERIAERWRFAVELRGPGPGVIQRGLAALRASGGLKSDQRTAVDVDPVDLL